MSQDDENLLEDIASLGGALIDEGFEHLVPEKYKFHEETVEETRDAGSDLNDLKNRLDLGQITLAEYEKSRNDLLKQYSGKLEGYANEAKDNVDYCPSCDAPLPLAPFGDCEYC